MWVKAPTLQLAVAGFQATSATSQYVGVVLVGEAE
jgi:hypothetical protein